MSEGRNGETANWWLCSVDGLCDDVCLPFFRSNTLLRSCVCSFSLRIGDPFFFFCLFFDQTPFYALFFFFFFYFLAFLFFFLQHTHRKFLSISPRSRDVHK